MLYSIQEILTKSTFWYSLVKVIKFLWKLRSANLHNILSKLEGEWIRYLYALTFAFFLTWFKVNLKFPCLLFPKFLFSVIYRPAQLISLWCCQILKCKLDCVQCKKSFSWIVFNSFWKNANRFAVYSELLKFRPSKSGHDVVQISNSFECLKSRRWNLDKILSRFQTFWVSEIQMLKFGGKSINFTYILTLLQPQLKMPRFYFKSWLSAISHIHRSVIKMCINYWGFKYWWSEKKTSVSVWNLDGNQLFKGLCVTLIA